MIERSETQVVLTADWHDQKTGLDIPCRAMLDLAQIKDRVTPIIIDLKTTVDASRGGMQRSFRNYGYDVQAWMYSEMMRAATGSLDAVPFYLICVRNTKPFLVATYEVDPESMEWGKRKFRKAMRRYCESVQYGFIGYTDGFEPLEMPV